jgi:ABC-type dipeptide/oligopeptide/nickel transport system permease component
MAALLGTVVVVEKLLLLNGAGAMLWQACARRDFPLASGITQAAAALVALVRLGAELARIALDPRARATA